MLRRKKLSLITWFGMIFGLTVYMMLPGNVERTVAQLGGLETSVTPGGGFGRISQVPATGSRLAATDAPPPALPPIAPRGRIIHADVVAMDQPLHYNRFGSVNPYGMIYALRRDVVKASDGEWIEGLQCPSRVKLRDGKRARPLVLRGNVGDILEITFSNLLLPSQPDVSKCKIIDETTPYHNLVTPKVAPAAEPEHVRNDTGETAARDKPGNDWPRTRTASIAIQGLVPVDGTDARCTGMMPIAPVAGDLPDDLAKLPAKASITCRWRLDQEGTHLFYSHGAPAGGEGDGGSLVQGLFGAVNVEPEGSQWYRSQVAQDDLDSAWPRRNPEDLTDGVRVGALDYEARYAAADLDRAIQAGDPILNMLKARPDWGKTHFEIIHSDLNALIWEAPPARHQYKNDNDYYEQLHYHSEAPAFREFTAIFHDELKKFYADAFVELEQAQLESVGDGFAINYGASGMGSILLANRKGIGPAWDCAECLYEEFFLQSWANGDPALLEQYEDDPSNVYHSYLNDRVRFRNIHAGPKETHVFHLHAHQWLSASDEDKGTYLDSQTIAPLQGFEYEIYHGGLHNYGEGEHHHTQGSGNRNRAPGDSIFHCHLYPHFAQGMWSLWRVHDVIEDGTRKLPDGQPVAGMSTFVVEPGSTPRGGTDPMTGESLAGTPIPAIVPLPGQALPTLPTYGDTGMAGYPFYVYGAAGHRAPQPPLDFAKDGGVWQDAGLPRHIFKGGGTRTVSEITAEEQATLSSEEVVQRALAVGDFSAHLESAVLELLDNAGQDIERRAMAFHAGTNEIDFDGNGTIEANERMNVQVKTVSGEQYSVGGGAALISTRPDGTPASFTINGALPQPGAPFADPCSVTPSAAKPLENPNRGPGNIYDADPAMTHWRRYDVSAISLDMVVNKAGWHDPQARINVLDGDVKDFENMRTSEAEPFFFRAASGDCITYRHTNRTPKELALDDFQVRTPTDIIGQHIHLVKFDVTSSDGSGNGFNYEDGTLAPDAVLERKCAANRAAVEAGESPPFEVHAVPCPTEDADEKEVWQALLDNDLVQTTTQRWFADPILTVGRTAGQGMDESMRWMNHGSGSEHEHTRDRTLRTVFTHDHFAPSSIQQHGFYSALLIEPADAMWHTADGERMCDGRDDQGDDCLPGVGTHALITNAKDDETHPDHREFALAVADFALLYDPRYDVAAEPKGMGGLLREAHAGIGNGAALTQAEKNALTDYASAYWQAHGRPVDAPPKPEAISKTHHNPYLVNYRHEAIPLRVGHLSLEEAQIVGNSTDCGGSEALFARDANGNFVRREHVNRQRPGGDGDPAFVFSSDPIVDGLGNPLTAGHGDPCTPILEAYEGEQIQIRLIQGAQEVQHMFTIEGLAWPRLIDYAILDDGEGTDEEMASQAAHGRELATADNPRGLVSSQEIGISEHFEMKLPALENVDGGRPVTDYLYHFGTLDALWNGAWGLIRTYDGTDEGDPTQDGATIGARLAPLPDNPSGEIVVVNREEAFGVDLVDAQGNLIEGSAKVMANCPSGAVYRKFQAVATRVDLLHKNAKMIYNASEQIFDPNGLILLPLPAGLPQSGMSWQALEAALQATYGPQAQRGELSPFVLRVNAGDCVDLEVFNALMSMEEVQANQQGLPDAAGDALMPRIVPLNVDQPAEAVAPGGPAEIPADDLRPSAYLALSLPLVHYDVVYSGGVMVGMNSEVNPVGFPDLNSPLFTSGQAQPQKVQMLFYAGLIELAPEAVDEVGTPICPVDTPCPHVAQATPYAFGPLPIKAFGDPIGQGTHGLFGAVVVEPEGAKILDPHGLASVAEEDRHRLGLEAVVRYCEKAGCTPDEAQHFREFVVFYQDGLNLYWPHPWDMEGNALPSGTRMVRPVADCPICDDSYDLGEKGFSYASEPFWARLRRGVDAHGRAIAQNMGPGSNLNHAFFPTNFFLPGYREIATPTYVAREGEEVRFRVLQPQGRARQRSFVVYGHSYHELLPRLGSPNSVLMSAGKAITAKLEGPDLNGDGDYDGVQQGCYLYRDGPSQFWSGGAWGSFIVASADGDVPDCVRGLDATKRRLIYKKAKHLRRNYSWRHGYRRH